MIENTKEEYKEIPYVYKEGDPLPRPTGPKEKKLGTTKDFDTTHYVNGKWQASYAGIEENGDKKNKWKQRTREELLIDYEDYRHVAAIWERQNKNAMPKLLTFPNMVKKEEV